MPQALYRLFQEQWNYKWWICLLYTAINSVLVIFLLRLSPKRQKKRITETPNPKIANRTAQSESFAPHAIYQRVLHVTLKISKHYRYSVNLTKFLFENGRSRSRNPGKTPGVDEEC